MIRMTIAANLRDGATTLREGDARLGDTLEAVTTLVLTSTFPIGRLTRLDVKVNQLSENRIVMESRRHLTVPRLTEVNPFPSQPARFTYTFEADPDLSQSDFKHLLLAVWAYAIAYSELQSPEVTAFIQDPANNPRPA